MDKKITGAFTFKGCYRGKWEIRILTKNSRFLISNIATKEEAEAEMELLIATLGLER